MGVGQILESGAQIFPDNHGKEVAFLLFCICKYFPYIYLFVLRWALVHVRQML